jgi:hypothetical protein
MILCNPSIQIRGQQLDLAMTASFQIFLNSLFADYSTIRRYVVRDIYDAHQDRNHCFNIIAYITKVSQGILCPVSGKAGRADKHTYRNLQVDTT